MSRVLEWVEDAFLSILNLFINISATRGEDPVVAEYKRRQRACFASTVFVFLVAAVGFIIAVLLDSRTSHSPTGRVLDGLREGFGYVFLCASASAVLYSAYTWFALLRFARGHEEF